MKTKVARTKKPAKGLFHHKGSGQWAAKVNGKLKYFGSIRKDPDGTEALGRYSDALAGRQPARGGGLKLAELVNAFLAAKEQRVASGELSARTLDDYVSVCRRVLNVFGAQSCVAGLRAKDFEGLRASFSKTHGAVRLNKDITCVRTLFKYGYDADLIDRPVKFGPDFKRPSRVTLRKLRQANGARMFSAAEIQAMIAKAGLQLKAMILLGINCGLGNADCVALEVRHLDLDGGWLNFPRVKTGINRRCPLWPETIKVLRDVLAKRKAPKDEVNADRVFVTKYGNDWSAKGKYVRDNPISKEMAKLLNELGIRRRGTAFYALRHTFATIGQRTRDTEAVRAIMGHVEKANDMLAAAYTEEAISDDRLLAVSEAVRRWARKKD